MPIEILSDKSGIDSQIGERIRLIRNTKRMTQKTFAISLGIAQGFLCSIERGKKTPSLTLMIAIQYRYKINSEWLYTGTGEPFERHPDYTEETPATVKSIPLLKAPPSSIDSFSTHEIERYISIAQVPDNSFAFEYSGEFMSPTIRDLDIVIINPEQMPVSGDIVLIVGKWGDSFLRRYRSIGDDTFFSADNSSYSTFKAEKGSRIIGVVDSVWRKIKY